MHLKVWWKFADLRWLNVSTNIASVVCTYRYELKVHKMLGPCRNCNREPPVVFLNFEANMYSNIYSTICNVTQLILSGNCSTCFGWYLHPSLGAQTTVSTASGIYKTVTDTYRHGVTNTRCCRYSCLRSRWWVEVPPETCRAVSR
jgi:hypothetical protein